jgi:hypothetical protein
LERLRSARLPRSALGILVAPRLIDRQWPRLGVTLNGCLSDFAGADAFQRAVFDAAPDCGSAYAKNLTRSFDGNERGQRRDGIVFRERQCGWRASGGLAAGNAGMGHLTKPMSDLRQLRLALLAPIGLINIDICPMTNRIATQ